ADNGPATPIAMEHAVVQLRPQTLRHDRVFANEQAPKQRIEPAERRLRDTRRHREDLGDASDALIRHDSDDWQIVDSCFAVSFRWWISKNEYVDTGDLHVLSISLDRVVRATIKTSAGA